MKKMTLANTTENNVSVIEGLAMEARALRNCIDVNMWQLARVFTEAKQLIPHGEWEKWLEDNADCSVRTAQDMIAAYRRFGGKPQMENIGRSKAFKLLPLPEEAEEKFMQEHDVGSMSAREIEKAVKKAREEERQKAREGMEVMAEDKAREMARQKEAYERKLADMENLLTESKAAAGEMRKAAEDAEERAKAATQAAIDGARDVSAQSAKLNAEAARLRQELQDRDDMIADLQEQYDRVQREYLNLQSTVAKGDAERAPADRLTPEVLAAAVRSFIGAVARLPHMKTAFAVMDHDTKEEYSILLETVEKWAKDSRRALDMTGAEGTVC